MCFLDECKVIILSAECRYAVCLYTECNLFIVMLSVFKLCHCSCLNTPLLASTFQGISSRGYFMNYFKENHSSLIFSQQKTHPWPKSQTISKLGNIIA
jgi:hypothetical protein